MGSIVNSLFIFGPLIVVNIWHGLLTYVVCVKNKSACSISEAALHSAKTLRIHRLMHMYSAVSFAIYAFVLMNTQNMQIPAIVLLFGAAFDALQSVLLNRHTNHSSLALNDLHQLSAWTMAVCYLVFAILYANTMGVSSGVLICAVALLILTFLINVLTKFRLFFVAQMIFFITVSTIIIISGSV